MVQNPKGGTAVLPKSITAGFTTGMWHDVMDYDREEGTSGDKQDYA